MALDLTWQVAALRLALTVAAGAVIGFNRGERGSAAGLRTVILVSLAACAAMLQVNALLTLAGKPSSSFVVMDLMRLPLGILSGMGFIGAGAILRRGSSVVGVTTAATLWLMTVVGLCFGGGQLVLGGVTTVLAALVLWALKRVEAMLPCNRRARLVVVSTKGDALGELVQRVARLERIDATYESGVYDEMGRVEIRFTLQWRGAPMVSEPSNVIAQISSHPGVTSVRWELGPNELEERG